LKNKQIERGSTFERKLSLKIWVLIHLSKKGKQMKHFLGDIRLKLRVFMISPHSK